MLKWWVCQCGLEAALDSIKIGVFSDILLHICCQIHKAGSTQVISLVTDVYI